MRLYSSYAARIIAAECPDSAFDDTVLRYRVLADMHEQLMLADRSTFEPELPGVPSTQISSELDAQITL